MQIGIFLLGLAVGSFLNSWIWRSRTGESVINGRSHCPHCRKTLQWYELVPLLSFAFLGKRCRTCRAPIDWQYPLVELTTGLLFVMNYEWGIRQLSAIYSWSFFINQAVAWYLLSVLVVIFVYDLRFGLVPDRVVLPAIVVALIFQIINQFTKPQPFITTLIYLLGAVIVGSGFFALQYYVSRGRWLGEGDLRIGALMGAMLGWPLIFEGLVVSYLLGGAVGIGLLIAGRKRFGETLPLGTFLTTGTLIVFLYGSVIWNWYWNI